MYLLYSLLYSCALVLSTPYFLLRSFREPAFGRSLRERFFGGKVNPGGEGTIWLHAVSVGEVMAAGILVPHLKAAFPSMRIAVSVTTPTGRQVAEEKLRSIDDLFYCPFDLATTLRPMVSRVRPRALLLLETEIWPNLVREARQAGAKTLLVNGRISDRSYPGYLRIRPFIERFLQEIDRFLMQTETYADRIRKMGARASSVEVVGSLKFDVDGASSPPRPRVTPAGRPILVAGSTLDPEERILLSVFERLRSEVPGLFLLIAPRHAPRFDTVFDLASSRGFRVGRRSRGLVAEDIDVLILDTLGELASVYAEADVAFVGGSLASWGGHNIIEPASWGKPVLFGPHMQNFLDVARIFLEGGGALQVKDEADLESALRDLLARPERREEISRRALAVVAANRGAASRTAGALEELLS
jgi:3-deoxy-D-manno-octulosonic-acid transferase